MTVILWYLAIGAIVATRAIWVLNKKAPKRLEEILEPVYQLGNSGVLELIAILIITWPYPIALIVKSDIKNFVNYFKKSGPN